jgi:ribose/xylose/arabinose/galactoside ABC-type transport system permease subunit
MKKTEKDIIKNPFYKFYKMINREYSIIYAVILLAIIFGFLSKSFFTGENMMNILRQASIIAIVAAGQYFVMIGGAFDLSVGSTVGLTGVFWAQLMTDYKMDPILAALISILVGALVGIINGQLVTRFNIPAFVATLGTMSGARGLVFVLTNAYPVVNLPTSISFLGRGYLLFIPIPVIIMICIFLLVYFISEKTKLGRYILAMGGNDEAAYLSGIKTVFYKNITFILCGVLSAIAGIIMTSRLNSGQPTTGTGYEFDSIIATVIGGVSLAGGKGKAIGVLIGAILVTTLTNGMTILNVSSYYQQILKGVVLIVAIAFDVYKNKPRR